MTTLSTPTNKSLDQQPATKSVSRLSLPLVAATMLWMGGALNGAEMVITNRLAIGQAEVIPATGSNIVLATEGIVRALPAGPGKLVVSAVKNGRTDMLVLDDVGKVTERYEMIVAERNVEATQTYQASLDDFRKIVADIVGPNNVKFEVLIGPRIGFNGTNLLSYPKPVLFMHGEAKDEIEADTIRDVASRFYGQADFGSTPPGAGGAPPASASTAQAPSSVPSTAGPLGPDTITNLKNDPNIVDQITIANYHQIRIKVQIAEVNLDAIKNKGIDYSHNVTWAVGTAGLPLTQLGGAGIMANTLTGPIPANGSLQSGTGGGGSSGGGTVSVSGQPAFQAQLQLLISDGYARLLSEPTLVTKSGHEASFLAGGHLILQMITANVSTPVDVPFGVNMTIKPTVGRNNHIECELRAEVSQPPQQLGTGYTFQTRKSETKLRIDPGNTLVLSGLLGNDMRNTINKIPWLGQIPILGALFRSKLWQNSQTELLFFITPEVLGDLQTDTARQVRTPAMQQWHFVDGHKDILPDPNSHASPDNDVHDLLGIPPDRMQDPAYAPQQPVVVVPPAPAPAPSPAKKTERKYY